ncbi:MAG: S9 family peptidase [Thermomicrobiales bacterium]
MTESATPQVAPYGTWRSPITADLITGRRVGLASPRLDGDDIYWIEARPEEAGRSVIVRRRADGTIRDAIPAGFNARSRVHEYGGGAYVIDAGTLIFANFYDTRLYRVDVNGDATPRPITPEGALRYADAAFDWGRNRLIAVREDHAGGGEPVNTIVALDLDGDRHGGVVLAEGCDFYSNPRLSPDGRRLAWLQWNHPNMPWDGTELCVGHIDASGAVTDVLHIAGGVDESIFQPEWSPDGELYYVSDRTGWWNLYRHQAGGDQALTPLEAEFGAPLWVFDHRTSAFLDAQTLLATYTVQGTWRLGLIDLPSGAMTTVETPYTELSDPDAANGAAVIMVGSASSPMSVARFDAATRQFEIVKRSLEIEVDPEYISTPEAIEFPTEGGLTAHAFYYPPRNRDFVAPAGELPPLLVQSHGGPTGATSTALSLPIQFWTSRGFAVIDVNYGGSTGYGRAYHQRLDDAWGIVDVDDHVNAGKYLIAQGKVDPERTAIRGWSASGYTTLATLAFRDFFRAGASHFGISDLETMTTDTHKFESRYLDRLIGPYPDRRDIYMARSPIHHLEGFTRPLALFQGTEDTVVPPDQAEKLYDVMNERGLPVAMVLFEGEGHGFRRAENIRRALEGELDFYGQVFAFAPAGEIEPVEIANWERVARAGETASRQV